MGTTIALSANSHKELTLLKIEEGYKNMDELVYRLIIEHKKIKLLETSKKIRARIKDLNLSISDLIE